jgi:hypothetical protein
MAALKDDVKAFIVQALACFDKPTQVVAQVKETFKLDVTRQQVETYDPTKYAGRTLNIKWRTLFEDTAWRRRRCSTVWAARWRTWPPSRSPRRSPPRTSIRPPRSG